MINMNKRFMELVEKEILTYEEMEELEEMEEVTGVEDCGLSGRYVDKHWWNVKTSEDEYDVYTD